jgi:hypothetical protein
MVRGWNGILAREAGIREAVPCTGSGRVARARRAVKPRRAAVNASARN